jgi:glycosyltransferase involved in cell wall biosynthesis
MDILEVVESCNAGVGRHVGGLCRGLAARGHRVTVAYAPGRLDPAFERFIDEQRGRISFYPLDVGRDISATSDLRGFLRLLRLMKRKGPFEVVHGHSSKGGALGRLAGRLAGVPTVYTPNGLIISSPKISNAEGVLYTLIERVLGRFATSKLIAVSEDERDFVVASKLATQEHVVVIENAIDDRDFDTVSPQIPYEGVEQEPVTFGSTMRFSAQKAPDLLIEAFVRLNRALPGVPMRLVVAGDGELLPGAQRQVQASGMGDRISLPGWVADPKQLLRDLDVFVVASLYESGLSYSTMEAMAAALPVVSTEVFGTRNTISKIPGNVLVPVGSPDALAKGMKRMVTMAERKVLRRSLRAIGQKNHDYVRKHFRQREITRRTIEVYDELRR